MIEITNEQKEKMASFWGSMITNEPQEFVVKEKYDELQQEIERLQHNQEVSTKWEIELTQKNTKLIEENKHLHSIIDKALELIYVNAYDTERKECIDDLWGDIEELVDILKGSDKE